MRLTNKLVLFLIFLVAAGLRFYNYTEIPYTHDEFSALFRTNFASFGELIAHGVKIDGHPAGVQVFLYYWTQSFGASEWIVKLPFSIAGLLSILLVYLIGKRWFNETTGLVSAAFVASMQYTVMYSQIARPYISGLFFVLLMVFYWTRLMQRPERSFYGNTIMFVVAASLCTYNHHFSLLFAAIVGISGLVFIKKEYLPRYIAGGIIIFLLYLPHLHIFLYQLNVGGVEAWLNKPSWGFITEYLAYLFHFSPVVMSVAAALFLYGFYRRRPRGFNFKYHLIALCWFGLPLLIGFSYSLYFHAVLQFSVLIFSFPFLLFLFFGHIKAQKTLVNLVLVLVILGVNTFSLIHNRQHYRLFYNSSYEGILLDYQKAQENHDKILAIIDSHGPISEYYLEKLEIEADFTWFNSFEDLTAFAAFVESQSEWYDTLYFGGVASSHPLMLPIIKDYYPALQEQKNYAGGTTYLFTKEGPCAGETVELIDFDELVTGPGISLDTTQLVDSAGFAGSTAYRIDSNMEWGPSISRRLDEIITHRNNFIDISLKTKTVDRLNDVVLGALLEADADNLHWGATPFETFVRPGRDQGEWLRVHHSVKLADANLTEEDVLLKTFIWNRGGSSFVIDEFRVKRREGNPVLYGLFQKIH